MTSITEQIAALIQSASTLNQTAQELIDTQEIFRRSLTIAATTLEVGVGKEFDSIQAAWNSLAGKIIITPITIKVDDGIYDLSALRLDRQPYSHNINIIGNVANPAACVLNFVDPPGGFSQGIICSGNSTQVLLSGFHLQGTGNTARGILATDSAFVFCSPGTITVDNCRAGIQSSNLGSFIGFDITVTNCIDGCTSTSFAFVRGLNATGLGNAGVGINCSRGATVICELSNVSGFVHGFLCLFNAYMTSTDCKAESCINGFFADGNASIDASGSTARLCTGAGFLASGSGFLNAPRTTAEDNNNGYFVHNHSHLTAIPSTALRNTQNYNLASNVVGAGASLLQF
jgi:hypothetical protein